MHRHLWRAALGALLAALAVVVPVSSASAEETIIDGLAGPLGLAVGSDGTVYVTEAFGGKLTSIDKNGRTTVLVDAPGQELAGVDAKGKGTAVFTQTLFDGAPGEEAPPLDAILGRVGPNGKAETIASLQDAEAAMNPDAGNTYGFVDPTPNPECAAIASQFFPPEGTYPGILESHPYAVALVPGGQLVADAAANTIWEVRANGNVEPFAVLPPVAQVIDQAAVDLVGEPDEEGNPGPDISACLGATFYGEPVPTDIEVGPDGNYYVSTLPGFPENGGAGAVWRIDRNTGVATQVVGGLSGAVDIAVAADGTIHVAELFAFQISSYRDGVLVGAQFADSPGAIEVAGDGTIYAAVGVFSASGSVVRL